MSFDAAAQCCDIHYMYIYQTPEPDAQETEISQIGSRNCVVLHHKAHASIELSTFPTFDMDCGMGGAEQLRSGFVRVAAQQ